MSTTVEKIEYKCDCGIDYGDCGRLNSIHIISHNSTDIYNVVFEHHIGKSDYYKEVIALSFDTMKSLKKLLLSETDEFEINMPRDERNKLSDK